MGFIYLFFLPVMLPSEIPKLPTDLPVRGFPGVGKLLLFYDSPLVGSPSLTLLSLFFIFYILSYLLSKTMVPGVLCQRSEVVGEKVVSPSYSSAILGLLFPSKTLIIHLSICNFSSFIENYLTYEIVEV